MSGCYVIAEAGVNHNGELKLAYELVDAAAEAGADAVKFQTFRTEHLVRRDAGKARYQQETTGEEGSQFEMLKALELSRGAHHRLKERAGERGIEFMSTPFDLPSLDFLVHEMAVRRLKISSGEITNGPLLFAAMRSGLPIVLSSGMSTLGDIEAALRVLSRAADPATDTDEALRQLPSFTDSDRSALAQRVTLLHCTSAYPTPPEAANLRAMQTMRDAFGLPVGYSDHTEGVAVSLAAAALGATVIEKHFTLDRGLPGPDHRASLEPDELAELVAGVRCIGSALGSAIKAPSQAEIENRPVARKSLVAAKPIRAGEPFSSDNLTAKRPADGVSPMAYWSYLGRRATRDYVADELIDP